MHPFMDMLKQHFPGYILSELPHDSVSIRPRPPPKPTERHITPVISAPSPDLVARMAMETLHGLDPEIVPVTSYQQHMYSDAGDVLVSLNSLPEGRQHHVIAGPRQSLIFHLDGTPLTTERLQQYLVFAQSFYGRKL